MEEPLVLTIPEACAALRIGRSRMFDLLARNEIRSFTIGRSRRIPQFTDLVAADETV